MSNTYALNSAELIRSMGFEPKDPAATGGAVDIPTRSAELIGAMNKKIEHIWQDDRTSQAEKLRQAAKAYLATDEAIQRLPVERAEAWEKEADQIFDRYLTPPKKGFRATDTEEAAYRTALKDARDIPADQLPAEMAKALRIGDETAARALATVAYDAGARPDTAQHGADAVNAYTAWHARAGRPEVEQHLDRLWELRQEQAQTQQLASLAATGTFLSTPVPGPLQGYQRGDLQRLATEAASTLAEKVANQPRMDDPSSWPGFGGSAA